MIGESLGHYRILSPLGAGGMGEVYLAEDTRLARQVAIKLLPAESTQDAERVRRFMLEAKAASALNHPNIITVYDIGESEAGRFIVMELVAGRTLRAVIAEDNSTETLLTLGGQIAKALSAAHAAGITHRDVKPDNIMVRDDGYVKVLDFGLARLLPSDASDPEGATLAQQTMPGALLGTVAYMSPEQARGQGVSDPSDIFALGIVLYELATGRHPFQADTMVGYLHAITLQRPAPPTSLKPELPAALNTLIVRMLEKDASRRPTALEVAQALQEMERRSDPARPQHVESHTMLLPAANVGATRADEGFWVAVLPFKYRGANADLEALAEGLSEDIVTGLSRFSYLRVIARGSTLRFKGQTSDVRAVGKELGARYVIEGSLRQAGSALRVAVQLVDASTGAHLWAETYDRTFCAEDIFVLQDDLVPRIVSTVADWYGVLPHSMSEAVRRKPPDQLSPYEAVLRSFGYYERVTPEEHAAVRAGLELAVEQAPGNADGWAMLSMMYGEEHRFGFNAQSDPLSRSLQAARRAVDAAHANHFAWLALAQALFFRKEFDGFRDAAERAVALNSMDGSTVEYLSHLIAFSGDWERGCEGAERARQLNPNHPGWYWAVHFLDAYRKGDYHTARTYLLKSLLRGGTAQLFSQALLAALYGQLGEREAADKTLQTVLALKPDFRLTGRSEFEKWYLPELVEHLMDGLRKAGLEIAGEARVSTPSPATETRADADQELRKSAQVSEREKERGSEEAPLVISPSLRPAVSPTFCHTVGRQPERNELRAAFKAAKAGRGSLLCVAGEPGIGKTTLVEDFLAELTADNQGTIARGRCSERLAGTEAYLPLLEALESLLRSRTASRSESGSLAATMRQLAPTWYAQLMPLSGDSEESARLLTEVKAASQERMKRELVAFLQAVAHTQPLVIFFDDLHWADVSTIDLLSFLAGKFDVLCVLFVVTYRPSDMLLDKHPFLQIKPDLQARGVCRELLLEFLNEAEIAEYLALEFPHHSFPLEFPKLIHAKTEGSPLFMADLVRYLRERSVIAQTSGSWALAQALPDIERELPESVRGMIERKIAQLSEDDRRLLTAASVQGYEFDSAVVAQVLSLDADEVEERLEKLERVLAFVKLTSEAEFPNRVLTLRYRFVHVFYQNALYASLRATRKTALSRQVAQALEGSYGERSASVANELALLWEAARDYGRAADCFLRAAKHASETFAHHEAAALSRHGLEALENLSEAPDRARRELDLQLVLGPAVMITKGWAAPEVEAIYLRARENCLKLGDNARLFPVMAGLWNYYLVLADYAQARELGEELLELARAAQDPASLVAAHWALVETSFWTGDFDTTERHFQQVANLYDADRDRTLALVYGQDPLVICNAYHATLLLLMGYPEQAVRRLEESRARADELAYPFDLGIALFWAAQFHLICKEPGRTLEEAAAVTALSQEHGFALILSLADLYRGWALAEQGELEEGIAGMTKGMTALRATGAKVYGSFAEALLAEALGRAGRVQEATNLINEAISFAQSKQERFFEAEAHRIKGELLRIGGATESEVSACLNQAIEIARRQQAKLFELRAATSLARLWQRQGKRAEAEQVLTEIYGWFTEGFDTHDLKCARALLNELLGVMLSTPESS